jgi:hypothetical protein
MHDHFIEPKNGLRRLLWRRIHKAFKHQMPGDAIVAFDNIEKTSMKFLRMNIREEA